MDDVQLYLICRLFDTTVCVSKLRVIVTEIEAWASSIREKAIQPAWLSTGASKWRTEITFTGWEPLTYHSGPWRRPTPFQW